jgi:diaphanous 1
MTSYLHNPALRLVSLHPLLSITCSFLRVPEIQDGYERRFFISATMTVSDVVSLIVEELCLMKTLPLPVGGNLEYTLEEVWLEGSAQSMEFNSWHYGINSNTSYQRLQGSRIRPWQ